MEELSFDVGDDAEDRVLTTSSTAERQAFNSSNG